MAYNQLAVSDINNTTSFDAKIWDIVVPMQAVELDKILQSPAVNILSSSPLDGGGAIAQTIFTKRLEGTAEQAIPKTEINFHGMSQGIDNVIAIVRYKAWGQEEIAKHFIKADLLKEVESKSSQFWSNNYQFHILNILEGVFGSALASTHIADCSTETMGWNSISEASGKLGESHEKLNTIIMHPKQLRDLKKEGMVKYYNASELGYDIYTKGKIPSVDGMWIIETKTVPVTEVDGVKHYHAFLSAPNSIEFRSIMFNNYHDWRTIGAGTELLMQRAVYSAKVPGVAFKQPAGVIDFTDAQIKDPANWAKVAEDDEDIPLVKLVTK